MKIPRTIRINGIDFTIDIVDELNDGAKTLYGDVKYGESKIRLNSEGQGHQRQCVTLWHEIFHSVCEMNGLEAERENESLMDTFAFAVYQILQDNGAALFDLKEKQL
jgi:hypothetical protein